MSGKMSEETVRLSWNAQYTEEEKPQHWSLQKPTHTSQYLLFDSHHRLEPKLGVIRTLNHRAETMPSKSERKQMKQKQWECVNSAYTPGSTDPAVD